MFIAPKCLCFDNILLETKVHILLDI